MTSNQGANPPFQIPQPNKLQFEESKEALREKLAGQQEAETDIPEDRAKQQDGSTDAAKLEDMENLADRHLTHLDSSPG